MSSHKGGTPSKRRAITLVLFLEIPSKANKVIPSSSYISKPSFKAVVIVYKVACYQGICDRL